MKKLFIFYMMSLTMIFSAHANNTIYTESRAFEFKDDAGDDDFLDNMDDVPFERVVIKKKETTRLDYIRVGCYACYHYCIKKPFKTLKYYMYRLQKFLTQRKKHDKKFDSSL